MLEQSDEVYDLPAGPLGFSQGERPDRQREVTKIPSNPWDELGGIQVVYTEFLDADQSGK